MRGAGRPSKTIPQSCGIVVADAAKAFSVSARSVETAKHVADKRRAVLMLLQDAEWGKWSNRAIADQCAVGHALVNDVRSSLDAASSEKPAARTYTTKHVTTATMHTGHIGTSPPCEPSKAQILRFWKLAHRRHSTPSELAIAADKARDIYDKQAKERQKCSEGRGKKKVWKQFQTLFKAIPATRPGKPSAFPVRLFGRRNVQPYQRAELALRLEPIIAKRAKANQQAAGGDKKSKAKSLSPKSAKAIPVHVDRELSKQSGLSEDSIVKSRKIKAEAPEEVKQQLRRGGHR